MSRSVSSQSGLSQDAQQELIAALELQLQEEINRRIVSEDKFRAATHEFEHTLSQRTELLQELVMQLQAEVVHRDDVEAQLRKRTDVMHDFIKQLEQEMEERRSVESNLRMSEERFRNVIEKSPVGICITNELGMFEFANAAYCTLFGYQAQELKGKPVMTLFPVDERTVFEDFYQRVFAGSQDIKGERSLLTKDGQRITVLTDSVRLVNNEAANEKDRNKLIIFTLDITRRKQAEDMLKRAKAIIERSPAVIYQFTLKPNYPIEFISENINQFGFTPAQFTAGLSAFMHHVHPEDRDKVMNSFRHLSRTKADHLRREYRFITPSGHSRWVEDNLMAVKDIADEVVGYQGVLFDIDERKYAEEEINKALIKEKELIELKSRFVTIASHEFRTPLTSILLSVGILKDFIHLLSDEEKQENFARITSSVHHMTRLLEDLLIFGRADAGVVKPKRATMKLRSWCADFAAQMQERYGKSHRLNCALPENEYDYAVDENMMRQILEHLLSNAAKYSSEGSTVNLAVTLEQGDIIINVQDTGIGIPNEDLSRIFEPFHRGGNIGNIGGTGMGLAVVEKLVGLLNGTISIHSHIGKGTTVTLILPRFVNIDAQEVGAQEIIAQESVAV
jgi:PAS domain S-box-containing protein